MSHIVINKESVKLPGGRRRLPWSVLSSLERNSGCRYFSLGSVQFKINEKEYEQPRQTTTRQIVLFQINKQLMEDRQWRLLTHPVESVCKHGGSTQPQGPAGEAALRNISADKSFGVLYMRHSVYTQISNFMRCFKIIDIVTERFVSSLTSG